MLLFESTRLAGAVVSRASSSALGMCGLAGALHPDDPRPVSIAFGEGRDLSVPLAPGAFVMVSVERATKLDLGEVVEWTGPGVLAFDGERSRGRGPRVAQGWATADRGRRRRPSGSGRRSLRLTVSAGRAPGKRAPRAGVPCDSTSTSTRPGCSRRLRSAYTPRRCRSRQY
jgi:hypothetical protein